MTSIHNNEEANISFTGQSQVGEQIEIDPTLDTQTISKQSGAWGNKDSTHSFPESNAGGVNDKNMYFSPATAPVLSATVPPREKNVDTSESPRATVFNFDETQSDDNSTINSAYEAAVSEGISQEAGDDLATARRLTTLLYYPDLGTPDEQQTISRIKQEALNKIKDDYGLVTLPEGVPSPDQEGFVNMVSNNYRGNLDALIEDQSLTVDQKAALKTYLGDPSAPGIPEDIKTLASQLKQQALLSVQQEYGLPISWTPVGPDLWVGSRIGLDALNYLQSMNNIVVRTVATFPADSSARIVLTNFLKVIGQAISALQQQLFQMQNADVEKSREAGKGSLDAQQTKIDLHKEALDKEVAQQREIAEKKAKADKLGGIMKIVGPIILAVSIVATLASLGTLGPAAIAVSATLLAMTIAEQAGKGPITKKSIDFFAKTVIGNLLSLGGKSGKVGRDIADFIGMVTVIISIIALCGATKGGSFADAVMMGSQVFASSNMVAEAAGNFGGLPPDKAAMIGMYVTIAVTVAAAMGTAAYTYAKKQEAGKELMASLTQSQAKLQAAELKVIQLSAQDGVGKMQIYMAKAEVLLRKMVVSLAEARAFGSPTKLEMDIRRLLSILQVSNASMGLSTAKLKYDISVAEGNIEQIRANAEANEAILQKAIDDIRTLIDQLMSIINSFGSWMASLEEFQAHKYKSAGDATTKLINASRG